MLKNVTRSKVVLSTGERQYCVSPSPSSPAMLATGRGSTVTVLLKVLEQPAPLVTVSDTVYVPPAAYTCVGLTAGEVPASPKFHAYVVNTPVPVLLLVKLIVVPAHWLLGA